MPSTAPRSIAARSSASSRSSRAASKSWIVGGTVRSASSSTACHTPSSNRNSRSSISMPIISSTNSGLPSAASTIRSRAVGASPLARGGCRPAARLRQWEAARAGSTSRSSSPTPTGPDLEQLRPCDAQQQGGGVPHPVREVLDQVEERRFGPMDVVEHDDERVRAGEVLEHLADSPERVLGRARLGPAEQSCRRARRSILRPARRPRASRASRADRPRVALGDAGRPLDHLSEREERDAFAV